MKKRHLLLAFSLFSSLAQASQDIKMSNKELQDTIISLIVSPYANGIPESDHRKEILYGYSVGRGCKNKSNGILNLVDFEGSVYGNFPEKVTKLPSASHRVLLNNEDHDTKVSEAFKLIKEKYCIDGIFSPVIDYRHGYRNNFDINKLHLNKNWIKKASDKVERWVRLAKDHQLITTFKHYPVSYALNQEDYHAVVQKNLKTEQELDGAQQEISIETINPIDKWDADNLNKIQSFTETILKENERNSMVMITNRIILDYGDKPYVMTDQPRKDPVLKSFKGLIITDDLHQVRLTEERIIEIFKNTDLMLISSRDGLLLIVSTLMNHANNDEIYQLIVEKSQKVNQFYKLH